MNHFLHHGCCLMEDYTKTSRYFRIGGLKQHDNIPKFLGLMSTVNFVLARPDRYLADAIPISSQSCI